MHPLLIQDIQKQNGRDYLSVLINMERNSKKFDKFNMSVFEHLYIIDLGKKFKANWSILKVERRRQSIDKFCNSEKLNGNIKSLHSGRAVIHSAKLPFFWEKNSSRIFKCVCYTFCWMHWIYLIVHVYTGLWKTNPFNEFNTYIFPVGYSFVVVLRWEI